MPVISVEHLSKPYRLGQIGTGRFRHALRQAQDGAQPGAFTNDLRLWWAKLHGKPNPLLRIGETDHGNRAEQTLV